MDKNGKKNCLDPIEEAWLYEEVGYIYEKAGKFEIAMAWNKYLGFFMRQIPDFIPQAWGNEL